VVTPKDEIGNYGDGFVDKLTGAGSVVSFSFRLNPDFL